MHAISSLWQPDSEDNLNVRALLDSTGEVVDRAKIYARWWRLWRADVRAGWVAFGRYKVDFRVTADYRVLASVEVVIRFKIPLAPHFADQTVSTTSQTDSAGLLLLAL